MSDIKLGYIIIYVPNVAQTAAFYEQAFGMEIGFVHESGGYTQMSTGDTALAFADETSSASGPVFTPNRPQTPAAGAEIALVCTDVAAAYDRAQAAGAASVQPPALKPWGQTVSYVRDCNGFLVELCSPIGA